MSDRIEQLLRQCRDSGAGLESAKRVGGLEPGDLFVTPPTSTWPVQWVLLREEGPLAEVVPADSWYVAGRHDLSVRESATKTPLTLRMRHSVQLSRERLGLGTRCGRLSHDDLTTARARLLEIPPPGVEEDLPDEHVASTRDHQGWIDEVIRPARSALAREVVKAPTPRTAVPLAPAWLARAALLLLLLTSGFSAAGWLRSHSALERSRAARDELVESHAREVDALRLEWFKEREARARSGKPGDAGATPPSPSTVTSRPVLLLMPAMRSRARSSELEVTHPPGTLVVLELDPASLDTSYHLEILTLPHERSVWSGVIFRRQEQARLALELPWTRMPPGSYRLRLLASGGEPGPALIEYDLVLRAGS